MANTTNLDLELLDIGQQEKETLINNNMTKLDSSGVTMFKPPTTDPLIAGYIWNNSGVLTISAG